MAGTTPMHVFSHVFDYVALGVRIGCMLAAGARALQRPESGKGAFRRSHFLISIKELEYQTNSRTAPRPIS
jgi:hypothetical protein